MSVIISQLFQSRFGLAEQCLPLPIGQSAGPVMIEDPSSALLGSLKNHLVLPHLRTIITRRYLAVID